MSLKKKLLQCCLFDELFYVSTYPDVRLANCSPIEHFLDIGIPLNRSPSRNFCSKSYAEYHLDVKSSGMSSIEHYLNFGRAESRQTFPYQGDLGHDIFSHYCEGKIESVYDGKVFKNRTFFLKGWINSVSNTISYIECKIGDKKIIFYPDIIRRDISSNKILNGFNHKVTVPDSCITVTLELNVIFETGFRIRWRNFNLWFDKFSDENYETKIIRLSVTRSCNKLSILLPKGYEESIATSPKVNTLVKSNVSDTLVLKRNSSYHLYADDSFQQHLASFPLKDLNSSNSMLVNHNRKLIVSLFVEINGLSKTNDVFVNGLLVEVIKLGNASGVELSKLSTGSGQIVIEIFNGQELIYSKELFLFVPNRKSPEYYTFLDINKYKLLESSKRSFLLLRRADSPTDKLYIEPFLSDISLQKNIPFEILNSSDIDDKDLEFELLSRLKSGVDVVVTRYIDKAWLEVLLKTRNKIRSITYLMDDDVLAAYQTLNLPEGYRTRMKSTALQDWSVMSFVCDNYINTSKKLSEKYAGNKSTLMHPTFFETNERLKAEIKSGITVSYHATGGHKNDIDFIAEIICKLLEKHRQVQFRIVLGGYCPEKLIGNPQIQVFKNMTWPEYQEFVRLERSDIGLAPLLQTPYNEAKSVVKLIDIAKLGAVGLFSDSVSYRDYIDSGDNGFILPNEPTAWFKVLDFLIENPDFLQTMKVNSVSHARSLLHPEKNKEKWLQILDLKKEQNLELS